MGLVLWWVAPVRGAPSDNPEARQLATVMFDHSRVSFEGTFRLSSPGGMIRMLDVRHEQRDGGSATYMEITAPYLLKGTRFLSFDRDDADDEHYTFVPMVRRSVRVPQWTLEQPFLGSTFYMIDIAFPNLNEFAYEFAGEGTGYGRPCRKLAATPLRSDYAYGKIVYCLAAGIPVSVGAEYFDRSGALLKVWTPARLEEIDGVWTQLDQTMENVQTGVVSRLEIVSIRHHVTFPPETFTKAYLDR